MSVKIHLDIAYFVDPLQIVHHCPAEVWDRIAGRLLFPYLVLPLYCLFLSHDCSWALRQFVLFLLGCEMLRRLMFLVYMRFYLNCYGTIQNDLSHQTTIVLHHIPTNACWRYLTQYLYQILPFPYQSQPTTLSVDRWLLQLLLWPIHACIPRLFLLCVVF